MRYANKIRWGFAGSPATTDFCEIQVVFEGLPAVFCGFGLHAYNYSTNLKHEMTSIAVLGYKLLWRKM